MQSTAWCIAVLHDFGGNDSRARQAIVALFITVLISQPVIVLSGAMSVVDAVGLPALTAAEPERGCRYGGADLTNHVPIFINGTNDFVLQDWPGSGTPEDPYRISRLNITYDVGLVGIRIIETDAYFVISDCFVKQVSSVVCIELHNTSHASIDHTTAISPYLAIYCDYTKNLQISWSVGTGGTNMALTIDYANDTVLQWNLLSSATRRGLLAEYCNDLHSEHNEYLAPNTLYSCAYLVHCNRTSSQYDYSYQGNGGLYFAYCEDVTILGFKGEDNQIGIGAESTPRTAISESIVADAADYGVYLIDSPNAAIDECILVDCGDLSANHVIHIEDSGDTQVTDTQILRSSGMGLYVITSDRITLDHNQIQDVAEDGAYLLDCENVTVTDNEIIEADGSGIRVDSCTRANVQTNVVNHAVDAAVQCIASDYANVYGNTISDIGEAGIWIQEGIEARIEQNTVETCPTGIGILANDNSTVTHNTVENAETGVYLEGLSGAAVNDNTILECRTGAHLQDADLCSVEDNTIDECWETGIWLRYADDALVKENNIIGPEARVSGIPGLRAILVTWCRNLVLDGNDMSKCGVMYTINGAVDQYNHTYTGNLVNGRPLFYGFNISEVELAGSALGQVILVASENVTVNGGTFQRCTIPVQSFFCEFTRILGVTSDENYIGFFLWSTFSPTVSGATVTENYYGVYANDCDFLTVNNTHMSREIFRGVFYTTSTGMTVQSLSVEYAQQGVYGELASYSSVTESTFRHISAFGVGLNSQCSYWNITDSDFFNCTTGVRADGPNALIVESTFEHCDYGIYDYDTWGSGGAVIRSEFYSNGEAIHLYQGDNWDVINCTILWSATYGIWLYSSTGPVIYGNTIALSGTANGYSNVVQYWDDGVSVGNAWDDYVAPPPYDISGAGATDRYPSLFQPTEPIIDLPLDVSYAEFSTGNYITWHPYDDFLSHWTVTVDGVDWAADAWNLNSISVNIDELSYGTHTVVVTVWDVDMNSITDEVEVDVYDDTPPTISHLPNTEAFSEGSGQVLTWDVSDLHPGNYEILRNDIEVSSGAWTTGNISTSLDGLDPGVYDFTISIYDLDGNPAHDQLTVVVLADTTIPTIDNPPDDIIVVGTVGNYITWTPQDEHPASYEVMRDGAVVDSGAWGGSKITFSIDGLGLADYNFTLTVYDGAGNSVSDSVAVSVYPYEGYVPPAFDLTLLLIAGAIVGVVAVVVVLWYFKIRRK